MVVYIHVNAYTDYVYIHTFITHSPLGIWSCHAATFGDLSYKSCINTGFYKSEKNYHDNLLWRSDGKPAMSTAKFASAVNLADKKKYIYFTANLHLTSV